ncbi:hypothetical protein SAMN04487995_0395 [Dyadobacter koreensis]|uniref:Uncharacterized protein n=1 Tax=Dyadobacter koreensis TaxID=408657 RepID=A0A1H6Q840_9BACT|nr:hypothetical protein [Dyadobacter koreensis]SEI39928.1 hypothetical protein SAMN04487995_0395 [Dyadobacter koreensis]
MKINFKNFCRLSFLLACITLLSCKKDPEPQSELENLYFGSYRGKILDARDQIIGSVVWQIYKANDNVVTITQLDTAIDGKTRLLEFKNVRFVDSKSIEFSQDITVNGVSGRYEGIGVLTYNTLTITLNVTYSNGTTVGESFDVVKI